MYMCLTAHATLPAFFLSFTSTMMNQPCMAMVAVVLGCMLGYAVAVPMPDQIILSAPFTPFHDDAMRTVNTDAIPALAANTVQLGGTCTGFCCRLPWNFLLLACAQFVSTFGQWCSKHGVDLWRHGSV